MKTARSTTAIRRIIAEEWPSRFLCWAGAIAAIILAGAVVFEAVLARSAVSSGLSSMRWFDVPLMVLAVPVAGALGFLFGAFVSLFIALPLYSWAERRNGGPFVVGDLVMVLTRKHHGKIGRVYSTWQGASVRVDLGPEAQAAFEDVLCGWQMLRVDEGRADKAAPYTSAAE